MCYIIIYQSKLSNDSQNNSFIYFEQTFFKVFIVIIIILNFHFQI